MARAHWQFIVAMLALLPWTPAAFGADGPAEAGDPYRRYIETAPEFRPARYTR